MLSVPSGGGMDEDGTGGHFLFPGALPRFFFRVSSTVLTAGGPDVDAAALSA